MDKCKSLNHDCTDVNVAMKATHENVRLFLSYDLLFLSNDLPHYYATLLDITVSPPPLKGENFFFIKSCTRINDFHCLKQLFIMFVGGNIEH